MFLPSNLTNASLKNIAFQAVYQGIVVNLIALFFMSYLIRSLGAMRASTMMAFVPVAIILFAHLFLGEQIALSTMITGVLCTVGIILYNTSKLFEKNNNKKYES